MASNLIEINETELKDKVFTVKFGSDYIIKILRNVPSITGTVYILELPLDECFFKDGSILVPGKLLSETEVVHSGILYMATLIEFLQTSSAKNMMIAVHDNEPSRAAARAENLKAFMSSASEWAKLGVKNCQTQDKQLILKWMNTIRNWSCDPGKVDNIAYGQYNTAVDNYQENHGKDYGLWPTTSEMYWKTWHEMIFRTISEILAVDSVPLPSSLIKFTDPYVVDCGETWSPAGVKTKDYAGLYKSRIDILLFEDADVPTAETSANMLTAIYGNNQYQGNMILAKDQVPHVLGAVVVDKEDKNVDNMDYAVKYNGTVVRSGKAGTIQHPLPEGTYQVLITNPEHVPDPVDEQETDEPVEEEYWEGGNPDLQALLGGEYQRKGAYKDDMSGFKNQNLDNFLKSACRFANCNPAEVEESSGAEASASGDSEQGRYAGLPVWLRIFQKKAATSTTWGQKEQMYSRLMGAFYYAYFVEKVYKDKNIVMPSNVEQHLEDLGKSSINKAATFADVGGSCDTDGKAYCASCASHMNRKGLEAYGYKPGFMGYSKDAGCPVGYQQGIHKGDEYTPQPGDILSVRTATGPLSGHVVTVVYSETDGTHSGRIWYVSGNAGNQSVSCDHVNVNPTPDRPPSGSIAVINRCFNYTMQPELLEAKSAEELSALKLEKVEGDFPAPNKAGVVPSQKREEESPVSNDEAALLSASGSLVASGDVQTQPKSENLQLFPLKIELKILDFKIKLAGAKDDTYTDDLLVEPGKKLCITWMAQNFKTLYLMPGEINLTSHTRKGNCVFEINPIDIPPATGGEYTLVASNGESIIKQAVKIKGIIDFWIEAGQRRFDTKKPPELLARVMAGKKYGTPNYTPASKISAMPGQFHTLISGDDYEFWWWGQISIKTDAKLFWLVAGPEGMNLQLRINRNVGTNTPSEPIDVTSAEYSQNVGGCIQGKYIWQHHGKYMTFFEADLQIFSDSSKSEVLSGATIRLRENYEMPGIEDFDIINGEDTISIDGFGEFNGGEHLVIHYKLKGGHSHSGLRFVLYDEDKVLRFEEIIYDWVKDGGTPTDLHKKDEHTYTLKQSIPNDAFFKGKAYLELFNRKGMVDRKG